MQVKVRRSTLSLPHSPPPTIITQICDHQYIQFVEPIIQGASLLPSNSKINSSITVDMVFCIPSAAHEGSSYHKSAWLHVHIHVHVHVQCTLVHEIRATCSVYIYMEILVYGSLTFVK